jgi:hypothetical protein
VNRLGPAKGIEIIMRIFSKDSVSRRELGARGRRWLMIVTG